MHDEAIYAERALRARANGYIMKQEATEKVLERSAASSTATSISASACRTRCCNSTWRRAVHDPIPDRLALRS